MIGGKSGDPCPCGSKKPYEQCCGQKQVDPGGRVWSRYRNAALALEHGRPTAAVLELSALYQELQSLPADLKCDVAFTYASALLQEGRTREAVPVLRVLVDSGGFGSGHYREHTVLVELGSAYVLLEELSIAQEILRAAESLYAAMRSGDDPILYFWIGRLAAAQSDLQQASAAFQRSLTAHLRIKNLRGAGNCCYYLAEIAWAQGDAAEAYAWAKRCHGFYQSSAPHLAAEARAMMHQAKEQLQNVSNQDRQPDSERLENAKRAKGWGLSLLDIDLLIFATLLDPKLKSESPKFELFSRSPIQYSLVDNLAADIQGIGDEELYPILLNHSFVFKQLGLSTVTLPEAYTTGEGSIQTLVNEANQDCHGLIWISEQPWPPALENSLNRLVQCYRLGVVSSQAMAGAGKHSRSDTPLPWSVLPLRIYTKYAALGEFETGTPSTHGHLLDQLLLERTANGELNRLDFTSIGFNEQDASALDASHIVCLSSRRAYFSDDSAAAAPSSGPVMAAIEEAWPENPPLDTRSQNQILEQDQHAGYFVDTCYRTFFTARSLKTHALYGAKNSVEAPGLEEVKRAFPSSGAFRVQRRSIPILDVTSLAEFKKLVDLVQKQSELPLIFRGQPRGYTVTRDARIAELLFGKSPAAEPSMFGAASRFSLDYGIVHPNLQLVIQDLLYEHGSNSGFSLERVHERWKNFNGSSLFAWDLFVIALAQHYGVPTHGLDVTKSVEVAVWFATHRYSSGSGILYQDIELESLGGLDEMPIVFVLRPHQLADVFSLQSIPQFEELGLEVLRAKRQDAAFFMAGDPLMKNGAARALVCAARLMPGTYATGISIDFLFPPPAQDAAYRIMLEAKQRLSVGELAPFFSGVV